MDAFSLVTLAVVTALPQEMQGISRRFPSGGREGGWDLRLPTPEMPLVTGICGLRAHDFPVMLKDLSRAFPKVKDVILLGCCGALVPELRPYDPLCALGHVSADGETRIQVDGDLGAVLSRVCPGARNGWFATSGAVLTDAAQKRECAVNTGALAVEMEGLEVAKVCKNNGLRFASLRWVLDDLEDPIPEAETREVEASWRLLRMRLERIADDLAEALPVICRAYRPINPLKS